MPTYSNSKVLLVEDEEAIAKFFELKLKSAGFDVRVVEDGLKALELAEKEKFDVMIVDVIMPKMNGYDFIKKVREKGNVVPIIVSSNLGRKEDRERAISSGANEYFVKATLSFAELILLVEKCLSQNANK
jgi:DNA-binding response OmpR family regulator